MIPEQETLGEAEMQQLSNKPSWREPAKTWLMLGYGLRTIDGFEAKIHLRAWCKPVTRDVQLDTVQSFYKAMFDETTLETQYCIVCGLQKTPIDLEDYMWKEFYGLYVQDHFQCRQCFP